MSTLLRIILIVVSVLTMFFIIKKIRNSKVRIEDSVFWFVFSLFLIILSVFPSIADFFARLLGIQSTLNFIFLFFIFILIIKIFFMTVRISQLESKFDELVQKMAIAKKLEENPDEEIDKNEETQIKKGNRNGNTRKKIKE